MNFIFLSLAVEQWFYILDGQHSFEAAKMFRLRCEEKRRVVPDWCVKFWCRVLQSGVSLENRQKIAGRQQARAGNVKMTSMSDNLVTFWRYVKKEKDAAEAAGREARHNVTQYLADTWVKSGRSAVRDGDVVCQS
jgi:hypothetical protein